MIGTKRYEFQISGVWTRPDSVAFRHFFETEMKSFVGEQGSRIMATRRNAMSEIGGDAIEELQFDICGDWPEFDLQMWSLSFQNASPKYFVNLQWNVGGRIYFSLRADEERRDAAVRLASAARAIFVVNDGPAAGNAKRSASASGMFFSERNLDSGWIEEVAKFFVEQDGAGLILTSYTLAASPDLRRSGGLEDLHKHFRQGELLRDWSISGKGLTVGYTVTGTITVTVLADPDLATARLAEITRRLGLVPIPQDREVTALTRRGFLRQHPSAAWFSAQLLSLITGIAGNGPITAAITTIDGRSSTYRVLDRWQKELGDTWKNVASVRLSRMGPQGSLTVDVDLRRDLVTTTYSLSSSTDLQAIVGRFELAAEIDAFSQDPYAYRKYGRTYDINEWLSTSEFGKAAQRAVSIAFDERAAAVKTAFVEVGEKPAVLKPFATAEEFGEWFQHTERFQRASLVVEGFRGRHVGIHVDRERKKFQLLANVDTDAVFNTMDKAFNDAFTRGGKQDVGHESATKQSDALRFYLPLALTALTAFLSLAWNVANNNRQSATLTIEAPFDGQDVVIGKDLEVSWEYTFPRLLQAPGVDRSHSADVVVRSAGVTVFWEANCPGAVKVRLPKAGAYTISVTPGGAGAETRMVKVNAKPIDGEAIDNRDRKRAG